MAREWARDGSTEDLYEAALADLHADRLSRARARCVRVLASLKEGRRRDPAERAAVLETLGQIEQRRGDLRQAEKHFRRATDLLERSSSTGADATRLRLDLLVDRAFAPSTWPRPRRSPRWTSSRRSRRCTADTPSSTPTSPS